MGMAKPVSALEYETGEVGGEGVAKQTLGAALDHLDAREICTAVDRIVIHERGANLQHVKHGGAIDFGQ